MGRKTTPKHALASVCGLLLAAVLLAACGTPTMLPAATPTLPVDGVSTPFAQTPNRQDLQPNPEQPIIFEHISSEEGLPGSAYWITQDHLGFLWIGTSDGLHRYDGQQFKAYRHNPDDPQSLSEDHVFHVLEDDQGDLWVATYGGGLDRFDRDSEQFTHYQFDPTDPNSLSHNKVFGLYVDRGGTLWVGTSGGGLDRYDPAIDGFVHYRHDPDDSSSLAGDYVNIIYQDGVGDLWIGTTEGLDRFDRQAEQFVHFQHDPADPHSLSNNQVFAIVEDHLGTLWVGTSGGGLNRLYRETGQFSHYRHEPNDPHSLADDVVFFLLEDQSGTLWVASLGGGLHRFDRERNRFIRYQNDSDDPTSLSSNSVNAMFEDREGTIWIGTTKALDKYSSQKHKFHRFLDYEFVTSMFEDRQGTVWVGTTEGLYRLGASLRRTAAYRHDPNNPTSLSQGWVEVIYEDSAGVLWIGLSGGGLDRFDRERDKFVHFRHMPGDPSSLSNNVVNSIYEDGDGVLWIGTDGGLNRLDRQYGIFYVAPTDPDYPQAARVEAIEKILEDSEGTLWVGTWGDGLKRLDRKTGQFVQYRHQSGDPGSLITNFVSEIFQDSAGNLWVGTDGGLHRFDSARDRFIHYGEAQGLPAEAIGAMAEDRDGNLWLGVSGGLARYHPFSGTFTHYDIEYGLHGGSYRADSLQRSSGELLFGGADGIVVFEPGEIGVNSYLPPVRLVALQQSDGDVELDQAVEKTSAVTFSWPQRDFEFEFASLSYVQPERNQHAYMLEGYDQEWNYIGANRTGRYTSLSGGDYVLRLKGSNNDGVWNEEGVAIPITIVPPPWATWWFRALAVLVLAGMVYGGYRFQVRRVETRSRELERQVASRTRELGALNAIATVVSGTLDLEQILNDALDKTLEVTGLEAGGIYLLQDDVSASGEGMLKIVTRRGLGPQLVEAIDNLAVGEGFSGQVVQSGLPLLVSDLSTDARLTRSAVREQGYRSVAIAPLLSRGKVFGSLFVMSRREAEFSGQDIELLTSIGGQIGVAIENARLYEDTEKRLAQVTSLQETSSAVVSTLQLDELLSLITQQATALLQADGGILNLVDWEKGEDEAVAYAGLTAQQVGGRSPLDASLSGWVTLRNQPVIANQVQSDERVDRPGLAELEKVTKKPIKNAAVAPMTIKGRVMDTLAVLDKQGGQVGFDQSDLDLLVAFANQAATVIENARLFETEQRRAEQFRVISEVGRQIASILDIDQVLAQVVRLIQQTFDYDHVGIALIEGDEAVYQVGAGELWDDPTFDFEPKQLKVGQEGLTGWVAASGEPLLVPDVRREPRYVWMQGSPTRSELVVPIKVKDQVLGVLDVQSNHLNAFDESDLAMLQLLANQAAIAIRNAQLFEAEQRRAEQFRVISEVGSHIASILTVEELLEQMARLIQHSFDYYLVEIGLVEETDLVFKTRASRARDSEFESFCVPVDEQSITGWVAATGRPLLVPDVSREPRYVQVTVTETRAELAVPMKAKEKIVGVINVQSDHLDAFDESDLTVLQSLANQAAIAIENARLYEQAQRLAVMEERQRLARELHDAVTQTLFSASLIAEALPDLWKSDQQEGEQLLGELRQLSRGALAEMRTLLLELRPAVLAEASLSDLLHQLGEAAIGRTGAAVTVTIEGLGDPARQIPALPTDVHITLYRIAQEALNNVVKHSNAQHVEVSLRCTTRAGGEQPRWAELRVSDDGRGFDQDDVLPDRLGLGIIRERAQAIGANLDIESRPGGGTTVTVVWQEDEEQNGRSA